MDVRGDESDIPSALTTTTPLPKETPLLKNGMRLRRDVPGRAAAHREIGVRYSMALWVRGEEYCVMSLAAFVLAVREDRTT